MRRYFKYAEFAAEVLIYHDVLVIYETSMTSMIASNSVTSVSVMIPVCVILIQILYVTHKPL